MRLTGDYDVDVAHTRLGFVARHAMVTKVRGSFMQFEGHLHIDAADPTKSSGTLRIVTASIDFFDMPTYPEITFASTAIEQVTGDSYRVTGDLTIKGVTMPVILDVEFTGSAVDPMGNHRLGLEATGTLNRKDWGITWNALLEAGGVLVSDKIDLAIDVSAIKSQPAG
ncbi:MAG: polyisoprenoid-binding protein [Streptosporangiales bacterium]|nr:polyisoprenoid-binding protein [Streptosporangiales bacterium]